MVFATIVLLSLIGLAVYYAVEILEASRFRGMSRNRRPRRT